MSSELEILEYDIADIEAIVEETGTGPEAVIPILQAIQKKYRYLPGVALERVCELTNILPSDIEGVATFYTQFRSEPVGKHVISLCDGTACHVKGSIDIHEAVCEELGIKPGDDTDDEGNYTIQKVACLGCCSLAPALKIEEVTYANVGIDSITPVFEDFVKREAEALNGKTELKPRKTHLNGAEIRIGLDSCCVASGTDRIEAALEAALIEIESDVPIKHVSCVHMCHQVPVIEVVQEGKPTTMYVKVDEEDISEIVSKHFKPKNPLSLLKSAAMKWSEHLYSNLDQEELVSRHGSDVRDEATNSTFLSKQVHIATEFRGDLDPASLPEYLQRGGFMALEKCLFGSTGGVALMADHLGQKPKSRSTETGWGSERIIKEILDSGLRGRGGAGFPTGRKWQFVKGAPGEKKYVICNGDEGDPGAFMDRMILESYSYRVIEGMAISALAVDSDEGILYIRAEYPLATKRLRQAILDCEEAGIIGDDILGSGKSFHLRVKEGAGAFVCGEETALIASLEGKRGMPTIRPPFPAIKGLWGKPTLINNTETVAMVPWIIRNGAEKFAELGTERSKGTKVFSLAGKIRHGGLIEVPMGITINEIVEDIGGGIADGHTFKAMLVGGPSGGCIPASLGHTPVDYEALSEIGAMMGSGGLIVLDDTDCIVEMCRYFLSFTQEESCGKCTPCRIGTMRMKEMLERLCNGKGKLSDLELLDELGQVVKNQSLCGLGKTAPNPVLTALKYFKEEFIAHVNGKCPAGKCKPLIDYWIIDTCIGCTKCEQVCPIDDCIDSTPFKFHTINLDTCTRCDACLPVCPTNAIIAGSRDPEEVKQAEEALV
ncbi:MAG: NAD(P)H-dependent oxidoreductase subunit E [Candidatus Hydrogenedentota bacterium]